MNPNQSHLLYPYLKEELIENEYIHYGWPWFRWSHWCNQFWQRNLASSCLDTLSPSLDATSIIKLTSLSVNSKLYFRISCFNSFLLMNWLPSESMAEKMSSKWENYIYSSLPWSHLRWSNVKNRFHSLSSDFPAVFLSYFKRCCIRDLYFHLDHQTMYFSFWRSSSTRLWGWWHLLCCCPSTWSCWRFPGESLCSYRTISGCSLQVKLINQINIIKMNNIDHFRRFSKSFFLFSISCFFKPALFLIILLNPMFLVIHLTSNTFFFLKLKFFSLIHFSSFFQI